uniref:Uncharacterized protein n=1 Tax=Amphilophus citrinellus TaxID=61819 RepID=A0A3Q0SRC2_AMPCI
CCSKPPVSLWTSFKLMDTLPAHLLPLVMEEFPQSLATACVCRAGQREPRLRCVQCGIIEEEEEDCSTLEEDQAQRSFLQTVESLRRKNTLCLNILLLFISYTGSCVLRGNVDLFSGLTMWWHY